MKKTAVLIYNSFCNFEFSVALEVLALAEKEVTVFAQTNQPVKEGYIISDNIVTSISYNFVKWGLAFGKMVGVDIPPATFGLNDSEL